MTFCCRVRWPHANLLYTMMKAQTNWNLKIKERMPIIASCNGPFDFILTTIRLKMTFSLFCCATRQWPTKSKQHNVHMDMPHILVCNFYISINEIKSAFTPKTSPKFLYKLTQSSMSSDALASDSVKHTNFVRVTITGGALNHISLRKRRGNQERFQCVEGMWEFKTKTKKGKTQKP